MTDANAHKPSAFNFAVAASFFKMEAISYLRVPIAIFWTFIYPIMLFFILNMIFGGGDSPVGPHLTYTDYLITGILVMTLISTSLFSFAVILVEQRANGNMKMFNLMPFGKSSFFAGFLAARLMILLVFCVLFVLGFSWLAPGASGVGFSRLFAVMVYVTTGTLVLVGLSLVLASLISRTATAHAVANIVNIPIIFLSDLFLPAAILPPAMASVVALSPVYVFVNELRGIYSGVINFSQVVPSIGLMLIAGFGLIWFACRKFKWNSVQ